jgi:hypothetical protein
MSLKVHQIDILYLPIFFPLAKSFIEDGLKHTDDCNVDDVKKYLNNEEWKLLAVFNNENLVTGAYVITYNDTPTGKMAIIISAAGKGLASKAVFDQLCDVVKTNGAVKIRASTRESVARLYKQVGFESIAILVEKKLWVD